MKTKKTIETTTEELSYMTVPGGPVDPKKGALVVWRLEHTTQRQSMRGTRKYKPGAPVSSVRTGVGWETGMGWEKQVARGGGGWVAEVRHPDETSSKGHLTLVREDRWDEFQEGALKYCLWGGSPRPPEGWYEDITISPEAAWHVVTSGIPVKVLNLYGYAHKLFDQNGLPLPQRVGFNYIDGNMSNEYYDLKAVVEVLQKRDDVTVYPNGGERSWGDDDSPIGEIPYYNRYEGRTHCIKFDWHPSVEDYRAAWLASLKKPPEANGVPWPSPPTFGWRRTILETVFGIHWKGEA